ncbi:hypothetical protein EIN_307290 [Entamoeba invadens IP1]|uniref:Uncharacterized protein n=1 Tax=Entamoeba invadens IP1 TaxID=370355 RepID=A0A0A1U260_ENTIV|nr:hypothetical protein EIN_307290 [Entamoeba invadens IP1]ELP86733.1 hypothetical protein EIN_307290 [Entamoeba invadens IP1]|eukprot:XP_004186079.1 hypothetical protein EIN_307290 [Entamoeba invadens IP1]
MLVIRQQDVLQVIVTKTFSKTDQNYSLLLQTLSIQNGVSALRIRLGVKGERYLHGTVSDFEMFNCLSLIKAIVTDSPLCRNEFKEPHLVSTLQKIVFLSSFNNISPKQKVQLKAIEVVYYLSDLDVSNPYTVLCENIKRNILKCKEKSRKLIENTIEGSYDFCQTENCIGEKFNIVNDNNKHWPLSDLHFGFNRVQNSYEKLVDF